MAEAGQLGLGQLEAVALVVAPAAQVDGLALARLDLHPEHVDEEAQALVGQRRQQLGVADVREVVDGSLIAPLDALAQAVEVVGERAAPASLRALDALASRLALARGLEHLVDPLALDDRDAVGVEHDDVALADRRRRRRSPARRSRPARP